ncbi:sporulation protein [Lewinella sp. JB7]|uniref:sporulation protein n=1 Tax=Lewinella sp. JB7 TaxID=2962887 RepID=UPI0020CA1A46|nr:sporulation protein [Lewinella sp. JB7]MCP9235202.1 sporulation protein [Lewinella sp. JB7]
MLGKVKQWLGIEGVKLELLLPPEFHPRQGSLAGTIRLTSKHAQRVSAIKVVMVEKYARGKDDDQLVDEYELGRQVITDLIDVPAEGIPVEVNFRISFTPVNSPVDNFGSKNVFYGGLAWAAKKLRGVQSEYRIEAEAQVQGVGLNPFDKQILREA